MLIESSFYRVLEVLLSNDDSQYLYEAGLVNLFSNSILLELNARNLDNPMRAIHLEKRYTFENNNSWRCDLYLDFGDSVSDSIRNYGCYRKNWIEAKYYGNLERKSEKTNPNRAKNIGKILNDFIRLGKQYEMNEKVGNPPEGYYFLVVFRGKKEKYLAISSEEVRASREEFINMFNEGIHEISLNIEKEVDSVLKQIKLNIANRYNLKLRTSIFCPVNSESDHDYYGYLIQILDYKEIN